MSASRGFSGSTAVADLLGKAALKQERFGRHLPYVSAWTDDVILTRAGDLMASVVVEGIDSHTSDDAAVDEQLSSFASLVGQLGERFGFYVNKVARPDHLQLRSIEDAPLAAAIDQRWQASLASRNLKARVLMLTVLIRPPISEKLPFLLGRAQRDFEVDLKARTAELEEAMNLVSRVFDPGASRRLTVSSGEWLALLVAIHGQTYARIIAGPGDLLAETMTNFEVTARGKTLIFEDGMKRRFGAIFGVKGYPGRTWGTMFDSLDLPFDLVLTNSFTPRRNNEMVQKIQRSYRQRSASDDAAISLTNDLISAADDVASGRTTFGDHHFSAQVFCDTEEELELAASDLWRAGQEAGATLVRERWASRALYFAQAPGNWSYRIRDGIISSHNFAAFAAFHRTRRGRPHSESPWGTNITAYQTVTSGLHRMNFHEKGRVGDEPSVGHTLVLGRTGSGKTLTSAFLMAQAMRADARVIVFDKDQGLEMAVRALGGSYSEIKVGQGTGFNPFQTETDARGAAWLTDWLTDILSRTRPLETMQTVKLNDAVRQIVAVDAGLRTFEGLASLVAATDDGGDLVERVQEWTASGRFGWLFSTQVQRGIAIGENVLGIDMTELLDLDAERTALLSYLFRRIERVVEDRRPTLIVIDEAWKMLADEMFVKRLHDWFVTMRKRNCVVMMLTQTPGHLTRSAVGQIIAESAATQILFPNARANPEDYRILNLNARETAFLTQATGGQRLALLRSGPDSVFINTDLSALGPFVTVLGGGKTGDEKAPSAWAHNPDFWKEMIR
jgi:type IV secretion system protein VirB4